MGSITSVNQLMEMFDPQFTWTAGVDRAFATMSFQARTDTNGSCDPTKLEMGYTEDAGTNNKITLDNLHQALQLILPVVGVDISKTGVNTYRLRRNKPIMFPYRGQVYSTDNSKYEDCYAYYARTASIRGGGGGEVSLSGGSYNSKLKPAPTNSTYRPESPNYFRQPYYEIAVDFEPVEYPVLKDSEITQSTLAVPAHIRGYYPPDVLPDFPDGQVAAGANADVWAEWSRNAIIRFNPYLDVLTLEGGQLQFVENPNPNPQNVTYLGQAFPVPHKLNETKGVLYVEWRDVPADFILDAHGLPRMFLRALGKVNSQEFLHCRKETLLLREMPELKSKPYGAKYGQYLFSGNSRAMFFPWLYDVVMKFIYFDPVPGNTGATHFGHNIFAPKGQQYYLNATRPPGNEAPMNPNNPAIASNPQLFSSFDFSWLFQYAETW